MGGRPELLASGSVFLVVAVSGSVLLPRVILRA